MPQISQLVVEQKAVRQDIAQLRKLRQRLQLLVQQQPPPGAVLREILRDDILAHLRHIRQIRVALQLPDLSSALAVIDLRRAVERGLDPVAIRVECLRQRRIRDGVLPRSDLFSGIAGVDVDVAVFIDDLQPRALLVLVILLVIDLPGIWKLCFAEDLAGFVYEPEAAVRIKHRRRLRLIDARFVVRIPRVVSEHALPSRP